MTISENITATSLVLTKAVHCSPALRHTDSVSRKRPHPAISHPVDEIGTHIVVLTGHPLPVYDTAFSSQDK